MKLHPMAVVVLFVLSAAVGLVGDHSHVVTGTTEYLTPAHRVPFLWSSPIWFPLLVGASTAALAEIRLHLPAPRADVTLRHGMAGVAAVLGIYVITGLMHTAPAVPVITLIGALAVVTYCALADGAAMVCGVLAAVIGPAVEVAIVGAGQFRYAEGSDSLWGVAPWLPVVYFAFGAVAALLGEIAYLICPTGRHPGS